MESIATSLRDRDKHLEEDTTTLVREWFIGPVGRLITTAALGVVTIAALLASPNKVYSSLEAPSKSFVRPRAFALATLALTFFVNGPPLSHPILNLKIPLLVSATKAVGELGFVVVSLFTFSIITYVAALLSGGAPSHRRTLHIAAYSVGLLYVLVLVLIFLRPIIHSRFPIYSIPPWAFAILAAFFLLLAWITIFRPLKGMCTKLSPARFFLLGLPLGMVVGGSFMYLFFQAFMKILSFVEVTVISANK